MPIAQTRLETLQICKLLQCVREEDRSQIEKLTINGVPHLVNYNEPLDGETALNIAAIANNDAMIEFLLELGAHPNVVDFKGRSAMMRAAEHGHVQCLENLAKKGGDMKLKDLEGKGILFYCIAPTQRHEKCMEIALVYGGEVNDKAHDGFPVFLRACETAAENVNMCIALLKKGADPNSRNDKTNRTALMAASASGSAKVVRAVLERGGDVNQAMTRTRITAAHEAAKGGFFEVLVSLAAYGANFDIVDDQGNNPLHYAAGGGHAMCCKFLSQRGCNPKPKNNEGNVPRVLAKDNAHKDAMKECRKAEKSFGKPGKNNEPWVLQLYDFCFERQVLVTDIFHKFDADRTGTLSKDDFLEGLQNIGAPIPEETDMKKILQAHDKGGGTIDYNEFMTGKKYVNKLYLMSAFEGKKKKKGGKGKKKKGKTKIPMPICTQSEGPRSEDGGPCEMFIQRHIHYTDNSRFDRDNPPTHPLQDDSAWYLDHPEKTYMNVNDAVKHSDLDSLSDAFNRGINVDTRDKYYKTPLMVACAQGNVIVAKFLLEKGANVHAQDNFKWTPLHFACHAGLKDVVEMLLENGANLEATTVNGATPFMRAVESSKPEVVQFLIEKGAKVQVENKKGQNPVDVAGAFADFRVFDCVKEKYDSLPPPNDKKKGKGKGGKGGGKRPASSGPQLEPGNDLGKSLGFARGDGVDSPLLDVPQNRKGSILRAASALAGGIEEEEDITYTPLKVWTKQPKTVDLMNNRENRRQRYGWEVDFEDFKMPFLKNVYVKVDEAGGLDADDD